MHNITENTFTHISCRSQQQQQAPGQLDATSYYTPPFPAHFKEDEHHIDTGIGSPSEPWETPHPLRKKVKRTAWSMKHGIADVNMNQVPIINLCYDKWGTQQLRALSQGLNCHVVVLENTIQAAFVSKLREAIFHKSIMLLK